MWIFNFSFTNSGIWSFIFSFFRFYLSVEESNRCHRSPKDFCLALQFLLLLPLLLIQRLRKTLKRLNLMEMKSLGIQSIKMIKIMLEEQCGVGYDHHHHLLKLGFCFVSFYNISGLNIVIIMELIIFCSLFHGWVFCFWRLLELD